MAANVNVTRPITYTVKVLSPDVTGTVQPDFKYTELIAAGVICPNPSMFQSRVVLTGLTMKYQERIMKARKWQCWNCEKRAMSMLHNPMSYLHLVDKPEVVDMALGVCGGGRCEAEGKKFFTEEMAKAEKMFGSG